MKFTWDQEKKLKVQAEHRVDFDKVKDVFEDVFAVEYTDEEHSTPDEIRFAIIGLTRQYGLVHLVFTEPSEVEVHFITARRAENWMVKLYDKRRSRD